MYDSVREEEKELERRIAQVAKVQARARQESAVHADSPRTHAADTDRKKRLAQATQTAEARHFRHNLKVQIYIVNNILIFFMINKLPYNY